jgi:hypothetical protein
MGDAASGGISGLSEVARDLVKGIVSRPLYAGLSLVFVVTAIVVIALAFTSNAVIGLVALVIFAAAGLYVMREMVKSGPGGVDTLRLARDLNEKQRDAIRDILVQAVGMTSTVIKVPEEYVRVAILGASDGRLRFIPGYTCGEYLPDEWTISMPEGFGSAGRAFSAGRVSVAVLEEDWGVYTIGEEDEKLHKDLRWMISFPVIGGTDEFHPIWVLAVDGLHKKKSKEQLVDAVPELSQWSMAIAEVAGFTDSSLGPIKLEKKPKVSRQAVVGNYQFVDITEQDQIPISDAAVKAVEQGSGKHMIPKELRAGIAQRLGPHLAD